MSFLWTPHKGPQTEFLSAGEFEVLYGGAVGGGKSDALLFGGLRHIEVPSYRALILRLTYPDLVELIDRSMELAFRDSGGVWNEQKKRWKFPSGAVYQFGYFEQWKHRVAHRGKQYQYIGWDELGDCPEERRWEFLISRCRSPQSNVTKPMMRGSANPGGAGHAWLKNRFIDKCGTDGKKVWVDPVTEKSRRFVPARVTDNPTLMQNDPGYMKSLQGLHETMRRQMLDGDWSVASGIALGELQHTVHLLQPKDPRYRIPQWAKFFGAFDWGFQHPAVFGVFMTLDDGSVVLLDSVRLWRKQPHQIVPRCNDLLYKLAKEAGWDSPINLPYIAAGRDCFSVKKARGENILTIAEQFAKEGMVLTPANQDRVHGLNNMRAYISCSDHEGKFKEPKFFVRSTLANDRVFGVLKGMVVDPDDPEDALKVDADKDTGRGGDDEYDMVRYGLASRPLVSHRPRQKPRSDRDYDNTFDEVMKAHQSGHRGRYRSRNRW